MEAHIQLAQRLPPQLLRFFTKYPPAQLRNIGAATISPSSASTTVTVTENMSSTGPNIAASHSLHTLELPSESLSGPEETSSKRNHNPFLPFRNPQTGNWHAAAYSRRRQAELFRLAVAHDVLPLMPLSPKHPEVKLQQRTDNGLRVQGTGLGKRVKGKHWERTMAQRLEDRRKAMEGMPELIKQWKERGHGRGWRKWPK